MVVERAAEHDRRDTHQQQEIGQRIEHGVRDRARRRAAAGDGTEHEVPERHAGAREHHARVAEQLPSVHAVLAHRNGEIGRERQHIAGEEAQVGEGEVAHAGMAHHRVQRHQIAGDDGGRRGGEVAQRAAHRLAGVVATRGEQEQHHEGDVERHAYRFARQIMQPLARAA